MVVGGFEEAVGVEDEAVAGLEGMGGGDVGGEGEGGEHEAVFFDGDDLSGAQQEHGWVSGGGVMESSGDHVEIHIGCGDELALGIAAEYCVHSGEECGGIGGVGSLGGGGEFDHGGDQRGRHSVARYVSD